MRLTQLLIERDISGRARGRIAVDSARSVSLDLTEDECNTILGFLADRLVESAQATATALVADAATVAKVIRPEAKPQVVEASE